MAEIRLEGLTKAFGKVMAVDHVDLEIKEGELVTLVGPSGCGKSTTLYTIAGLEEPTSGLIKFDDQVVNHLDPKDRNIAMVFQDYALYPHLTVAENLSFALRLRRVAPAEIHKRVQQVAEMLEIGHLLHRKPGQLSGGQRQRVALGRAMVRAPRCFLMDEPLSNLDAALRVRTRTEIKALQREFAVTTVFVTHDQEEAMVLSDRIAVMRAGKLMSYDTPEGTYNNPANLFVAGFVGSPAMNFVEGTVAPENGHLVFSSPQVTLRLPARVARTALDRGPGPVVLGVRPEAVAVAAEQHEGATAARVDLVEPVGAVTYVDLKLGTVPLKASVPPEQRFEPGQVVGVTFNPAKTYLFDQVTGARV